MTLKRYADFEETDLWFEKRLLIFTRALESVKIGTWNPFVQSTKGMTLKFAEELCVMAMKNSAIFEEESACHFKTDLRNLTNFDSSTQKSKRSCSLFGSFDQGL